MENNATNTAQIVCSIERLLREISTLVKRKERDIVSQFSITLPQFSALLLLKQEGDMTIGEMSRKLCLACSTMTDLIDRMEKNKVLERVRDQRDRRVIRIHLLEKGQQMIQKVMDARCQYLTDVLSSAPSEKILILSEQLSYLREEIYKNK